MNVTRTDANGYDCAKDTPQTRAFFKMQLCHLEELYSKYGFAEIWFDGGAPCLLSYVEVHTGPSACACAWPCVPVPAGPPASPPPRFPGLKFLVGFTFLVHIASFDWQQRSAPGCADALNLKVPW